MTSDRPPTPPRPVRLFSPLLPFRGRRVLVAVSGGADSVGLLRALVQAGADPVAAHLDHALRAGSAEDAAFVATLAADLGQPLHRERVDVAAVAARRGWNLEEAARRLRYSFLARTARQQGIDIILTAHTRSDQAETVLWQLLRGEAVLTGMPARHGHLVRPWLDVSRAEIRAYLEALDQPWREDPSNLDLRFTRNWIRHEVMPLLDSRFPGLEASLARLARFQGEDDAALAAQALTVTDHTPLARQPLAVLRRFARQQLKGSRVMAGHLDDVAGALRRGETRHMTLPGRVQLTVTGGRLVVGSPPAQPPPAFAYPDRWTLRHRLPGDRMRLSGGTRKVSDILTDLKVPREQRGRIWLLAEGQAVRWLGLPGRALWAEGAGLEAGQTEIPDPEWLAMGEALGLARRAAEAGEVPIGAVVLHRGRVIAGAANRCRELGDLTRHAEVEVLRLASGVVGPYLTECTLVVTLEPCPMCLGAALEARVARVVFAAPNPKAGALGGVSDLLAHHWGHRPEVRAGLRAGESARLLREMFAAVRTGPSGGGAGRGDDRGAAG